MTASSSKHFVAVLLSMMVLSVGQSALANRVVAFFVEPSLGVESVLLSGVEIERSFVAPIGRDNELSWSEIDPEGVIVPVGRMLNYHGKGMVFNIGAGIKISGLRLGAEFSFLNATFKGYSKRYLYQIDQMQSGGQQLRDTSDIPIFRVLGLIKYGVPVRKLLVNFQTRVGGMFLGNTSLVVGRAAEENNGFTADVGIELAVRPVRWFSAGLIGTVGGFFFAGSYEGATGVIGGARGNVSIYF